MAITLDGTAGVTIGASSNYTFGDTSTQGTAANSGNFAFKNRIINGAMVIDQRNAGASVTPNNSYTLDRWQVENSQTGKLTVQQNAGSVTPPAGFTNYLGITSSSAYSIGAGDYFFLEQKIEGYNVADLAWGTANAKTITLSFWVRSSLTGTFGGSLENVNTDRSYPFSYTISSANTWEQKTVTITGDTTGTWNTTTSAGIRLYFGLGVGSTYSTTAGAWTAGNYVSATGATSVVGTNGATFYITGVQLEKNPVATAFDVRPYGTELALCQRYYQKFLIGTYMSVTGYISYYVPWKVSTRTTPTPVLSGGTQANYQAASSSWNESDTYGSRWNITTTGAGGWYGATCELTGAEL